MRGGSSLDMRITANRIIPLTILLHHVNDLVQSLTGVAFLAFIARRAVWILRMLRVISAARGVFLRLTSAGNGATLRIERMIRIIQTTIWPAIIRNRTRFFLAKWIEPMLRIALATFRIVKVFRSTLKAMRVINVRFIVITTLRPVG